MGNCSERTLHREKKINSLVKKECCNYNKSKGTCILLDTKCPQMITASIICSWCREAIIPLDKFLEQGIFEPEKNEKVTAKKCAVCGKAIQANPNRAKYCPKCALQVHKNKTVAARKKKQINGCN